jgi:hypothetical protein
MASIALHPAFRGDREPPLIGMERADYDFDLGQASSEFLETRKKIAVLRKSRIH